jgi:integrase
MGDSIYLFPSTTGGMRFALGSRQAVRDVLKAPGWSVHLTPREMRRTFQDLARKADIHDVIARAISGHATDRMQRQYSTAHRDKVREAMGKVISLATARADRTPRSR